MWSHDTLAGCAAVHSRHYPVLIAGIWADLGLPVVEDGVVRMLVGVGNKAAPYDGDDVALLQTVARRIWSVARQRRVLERYLDLGRRFRHVQELAAVTGLEYDVDEDRLAFDDVFAAIFGLQDESQLPSRLQEFLDFVAAADHERVRGAFAATGAIRQTLRIEGRRRSGEHFPAELKVEFRLREVGTGVICFGILQDVSDELLAEELRRRADHDPLTGLPNRHRLHDWFAQGRGRRGGADHFAFHYVDLDDFKPVNDARGHTIGDEVLRVLAQRLQQTVRRDDLVVRMGGDEFVVVQTGIDGSGDARVLAGKILDAVGAPITGLGEPILVGASIGIAVVSGGRASLGEVSAAADRALYRAKAEGGRRYVVAGDAAA